MSALADSESLSRSADPSRGSDGRGVAQTRALALAGQCLSRSLSCRAESEHGPGPGGPARPLAATGSNLMIMMTEIMAELGQRTELGRRGSH